MKYTDLIESGATPTVIKAFVVEGDATAVTFRIPKNLKDAAMEAASLKGMSFSAFMRMCMIDNLAKKD